MIKIALSIAAMAIGTMVPLGAPVVAAGQSSDEQLRQLVAKGDQLYAEKGFSPTGWSHQSSLAQGGVERLTVSLSGHAQYQVVGLCDTGCSDIDIRLYDSSGTQVDQDVQKDDVPIVGVAKDGIYTVQLSMVTCSAAQCSYAIKAYWK